MTVSRWPGLWGWGWWQEVSDRRGVVQIEEQGGVAFWTGPSAQLVG